MHRALTASRRGVRPPVVLLKHRLRGTRSFSRSVVARTDSSSSAPASESTPKKRGFFRRLAFYSAGLIILFYATGPVIAANNERFNVFFAENVPFGEVILNYTEEYGLDKRLRLGFIKDSRNMVQQIFDSVKTSIAVQKTEEATKVALDKVITAKASTAETVEKAREAVKKSAEEAKQKFAKASGRAEDIADDLLTKTSREVHKASEKAAKAVDKAESGIQKTVHKADKMIEKTIGKPQSVSAPERPASFSEGVHQLAHEAEEALAGTAAYFAKVLKDPNRRESSMDAVRQDFGTQNDVAATGDKKVYPGEIPVGFEPPPGFTRPEASAAPQKVTPAGLKPDGVSLPLIAPAVAELGASEPVISELASTIDSLASFVKENPKAASAVGIIDTAREDLRELAARIEQARADERAKLEAELNDQAREYTLKLLELEMAAQDKFDEQELEFKSFFEEERKRAAQQYREELENELRTQSEIINERLKAEVIAQGIEMQRRWIREIKVRVEQERAGRLARLDELATNIKKLERLTLDNAAYLDENLRLHASWAALRTLIATSVEAPERRPFRDELRVLRHTSSTEDELMRTVLDQLEQTDVSDIGVEPLADLALWFTTSVAPQVAKVALVPEHNAGVLSHLASNIISIFRFPRHGLVEGDDVLSVLARAEYYLTEKNLDLAARELNQLKGAPKVLLHDWLEAARRRLEVLQALEVVRAQTTLASLRVV